MQRIFCAFKHLLFMLCFSLGYLKVFGKPFMCCLSGCIAFVSSLFLLLDTLAWHESLLFAYFLFTHIQLAKGMCHSFWPDDTRFMSGSTVLLPSSNAKYAGILFTGCLFARLLLMQKVLGMLQLNSIQSRLSISSSCSRIRFRI